MELIEEQVDPRGRQSVQQLLQHGVCGAAIYPATTGSTNNLALEHLRSGRWSDQQGATLFLTDHQTGGRGRHGRSWQSGDGTLTFSLLLTAGDRSTQAGQLTGLAVGVAVARAIEFELAPLKARLKWPNDVFVNGGKTAGILLETVAGMPKAVVVGVGVNVGSRPDLGEDPRAQKVSDLSSGVGRKLHRYDLLPAMVEQIVRTIEDLACERDVDELLRDFRDRCLLNQQPVTFRRGTQSCRGFCRGIGPSGELVIETDDGIETLTSGEVERIRIA